MTAAIIALLLFGLWGFFPKLAMNYISPGSAIIYEVAGIMVVGLLALSLVGFRPEVHAKGILFAVLTGVTGLLGTLFYFYAVRNAKVSVVVSLTALYPLITILLALIVLREPISLRQLLAIILAMASLVLFAT
jgi:transporter family protein